MIKEIKNGDQLLAIIIPHDHKKSGISFLTDGKLSQQLAYMEHAKGHNIAAHIHNAVKREVVYTQETLVIRKGKLRVDFYGNEKNYLESYVLSDGDVILLVSGGHGFKVLEDIEMIEIKQGPYAKEDDKVKFTSVDEDLLIMRE